MDLNANNIGKRIKALRLERNMTQEQLAEKSSRHFTYVGRVERGEKNVSVQALADILNALEIKYSDFFLPFEMFEEDNIDIEFYTRIAVPFLMLNEEKRNRMMQIFELILEEN